MNEKKNNLWVGGGIGVLVGVLTAISPPQNQLPFVAAVIVFIIIWASE